MSILQYIFLNYLTSVVRLVNGKQETEGRVELLHDGKWGTVCDDDFDKADGDVICKMIGYKEARYDHRQMYICLRKLSCLIIIEQNARQSF